jgi:AraC-like DNA-binding protein
VTTLDAFHRGIRRAFQARSESFRAFGPGLQLAWGYETRRAGSRYHWEGSRRGEDKRRPRVLFQYTLAGRGEFGTKEQAWTLGPEDGFIALLPSGHHYLLPDDSAHWSFFWFIVQHPLLAERVRKMLRREEPVQRWPHDDHEIRAAAMLFTSACAGQLRHIWNFEERIFGWWWAVESALHHRRYPTDQRRQLLEKTRRIVLKRLERPPSGSELAEAQGLERSTFSRKFKAVTGLSPMAFVTEVRLEEALKLLRTKLKLEAIAAQTGFADANHFCKVFRRHFHSTPGGYRDLVA